MTSAVPSALESTRSSLQHITAQVHRRRRSREAPAYLETLNRGEWPQDLTAPPPSAAEPSPASHSGTTLLDNTFSDLVFIDPLALLPLPLHLVLAVPSSGPLIDRLSTEVHSQLRQSFDLTVDPSDEHRILVWKAPRKLRGTLVLRSQEDEGGMLIHWSGASSEALNGKLQLSPDGILTVALHRERIPPIEILDLPSGEGHMSYILSEPPDRTGYARREALDPRSQSQEPEMVAARLPKVVLRALFGDSFTGQPSRATPAPLSEVLNWDQLAPTKLDEGTSPWGLEGSA